jgi:hypothetical protein
MKKINVAIVTFCIVGYGMTIQAQNAIPASGSNASGSGGTVSYSIGQVVYTTCTSTSGSVTNGVQQPFEISVITGLEETKDINLICSVYPNPTSSFLTLKVENFDKEDLSFKLFDSNGKLLERKMVTGNETIIPMTNLFSGIYFLKVINSEKEIKTFKIIRN